MTDDNSSGFVRRTKRLFDESVSTLDAATRSRLTQARHRALERATRDRGWAWSLVPAGTVAATALLAWMAVWQAPAPSADVQTAQLTDLEILLGEEDLEMLDEEIEFYGWLEEQPEFVDGDSVG
jgi:hypothetical protein